MLHSKLKQAVAMPLAALALLALAAPAAAARKAVAGDQPSDDLILLPVKPLFPIDVITPCICLPPIDADAA